MKSSTLLKTTILLVCLGIPLAAALITRSLTRPTCQPGAASACGSGQVCTRIDARGRTVCLPELPPAPFELGSPYEAGRAFRCVQGPRAGTHLDLNQIDAVDLSAKDDAGDPGNADTSAAGKPGAKVLAGIDGIAYVFTGCKVGAADCGWGFGNYVQIFEESHRYAILYAGLSEISIRNGYPVKRGDVIGREGATSPEPVQPGTPSSRLHWQVNLLEDPSPKLETLEKPAWRTRSVPFRYAGAVGCG